MRPFGLRDKIGYMFGDFGNDFTFIFASSFLMVFYTKVLGISGGAVGTLFLVARFVDAFTDVTMGRIVDSAKPARDGRFRCWLRRMCAPVALASFLMYQSAMATPLLIYTTDAQGNQIVRGGSTFPIIAGVFSVCAVLCYLVCYKLTIERVKVEKSPDAKQVTLAETFGAIFKSRALLGIIGAAIFLLLSQLLIGSMNNFLYPEYFKNAAGISVFTMLSTFSMLALVAPLSVIISRKYGKKESAALGLLFSGIIYLIMFFMKIKNMWLFLALSMIGYLGLGYFNTVIWANITDVIDDQEVKTGVREDGTVYAVYSFARKVGQALAGGAGGWALAIIGYESTINVQSDAVIQGIYTTATLIPAICFFVVSFFLWVVYPLNKMKVEENVRELKQRRGL